MVYAAAKSRQSCLTLCDPIDSSPPGSRPWDSPGKNTGVGCHFLLQCMKVKSESEVVQLCPTLCDPVDCSLPGSPVHGISQTRVLEWVAIAFSNHGVWHILQFSSVAQLCQTLCDPVNHSMPGLPVHHQLPSLLELISIESVMPSSHLILFRPLLFLPPVPPTSGSFPMSQLFA